MTPEIKALFEKSLGNMKSSQQNSTSTILIISIILLVAAGLVTTLETSTRPILAGIGAVGIIVSGVLYFQLQQRVKKWLSIINALEGQRDGVEGVHHYKSGNTGMRDSFDFVHVRLKDGTDGMFQLREQDVEMVINYYAETYPELTEQG